MCDFNTSFCFHKKSANELCIKLNEKNFLFDKVFPFEICSNSNTDRYQEQRRDNFIYFLKDVIMMIEIYQNYTD